MGGADNARVFRGAGARYQEAGSIDFGKSRINEGNVTLSGFKGDVTLGDNGQGVAAVSSAFGGIIDSLLGLLTSPAPAGGPPGIDLGGLLSSATGNPTTAADNASITDASWWTTPRKVVAAVLVGLLLLLIFKK